MKKMSMLMCAVLLFSGCQSTSHLFYWGDYEALVHTRYSNPGAMPASRHVSRLQNIVVEAQAENLRPAPGVYAQLGVSAIENGQKSLAKQAFQKEAELYPESAFFMRYLLNSMDAREMEGAIDEAQ